MILFMLLVVIVLAAVALGTLVAIARGMDVTW